jgi:hypothetical protein
MFGFKANMAIVTTALISLGAFYSSIYNTQIAKDSWMFIGDEITFGSWNAT